MSLTKDEIAETFYTAGLTTLGAVGVGYASRKLTRDVNHKTCVLSSRRLPDRTILEEEGLLAGQPVQDHVELEIKRQASVC